VRKSRFSTRQITNVLEEAASGAKIAEVCLRHGISVPTYYLWKAKYQQKVGSSPAAVHSGFMSEDGPSAEGGERVVKLLQRIHHLEQENDLLRKLFVEISLEKASLKMQEKTKTIHSIA
jgi:putative transposase